MYVAPFVLVSLLGFLCESNGTYTSVQDDVKVLPFVTIYPEHKSLHLVKDYYRLIQTINLKPIADHINYIANGFSKVKRAYTGHPDPQMYGNHDLETKLTSLMEQLAESLEAGIQLLPHEPSCLERIKRDIDQVQDPVGTTALFPAVGQLFTWITGTLSSEAGHVINTNYRNIKRLTKLSVKFALMFNSTLSIERKHGEQIKALKKELNQMYSKFGDKIDTLERKILFQGFIQNIILLVEDLQRTVDIIFHHTDMAELNQMGPLTRDPTFLKSINLLINGGVGSKLNKLYLVKIGSEVNLQACGAQITIVYKFPILMEQDFIPRRTISIPKEIKQKFFQLAEMPYLVTWSSKVYAWTLEDYQECKHFNRHIFCHIPAKTVPLRESCIFNLLNNMGWKITARVCPLIYVEHPVPFVTFLETTMVYFTYREDKEVTILCPSNRNPKPMLLKGSGKVTIPNGCKVQYGQQQTHTMGHTGRSANVTLALDDNAYHINFTHFAPIMQVTNVLNMSSFWEDTETEERELEQGVETSFQILRSMSFSTKGLNITVYGLMGYAVIAALFIALGFYCILVPSAPLGCRSLCCCCCMT